MNWYRSLYWRIAIGFVVVLAAMLAVQAILLVWAVAQSGRTLPGQSPASFAQTVALDLANSLDRDPRLDVEHYIRDQYARDTHPFFVMMANGQVATSGGATFPEPLFRMARATLQRRLEGPELGAPGGFRFRPASVIVNGQLAGVVVVPPRAPFGFLLGRFAPTLALVAAGVLIVGTVLASAVIFGPPRRRLRDLESAARRLGAGDLSARAPDRGGDEIAEVATAFNAMADQLAAREAALTASDRVRRQLLADVSHELTTPVTAMRGYLETLTMDEIALDEATRARYLAIIGDETARLERIIGDLLDLARLEGGGTALTIENVPVAQLFARVKARHERACEKARIALHASVEPGAETVPGDRSRLEQALQNLAANAIRYAPQGSTIRLTARPVEGDVGLSIEDEGPGIPPEHLPHIFDRFYKAEAARGGTSSSSGLGLSIVKAIVERQGGRLSVSSRPGRTIFEIVLPSATTDRPTAS